MSKRGNDLVRRYLWMAALSAVRCNPAVRALYLRVVAKHPDHKAIAIGHAMRKLSTFQDGAVMSVVVSYVGIGRCV